MFGIADKVLAYVGGGLALALALALATVTLTKNATVHSLEKQTAQLAKALDNCNADRTTLRNNQGVLEQSIAQQNQSLEAVAATAAAKYQRAAPERSGALDAAAAADQRARAIASAKPQGDDAAKAADTLILESLK